MWNKIQKKVNFGQSAKLILKPEVINFRFNKIDSQFKTSMKFVLLGGKTYTQIYADHVRQEEKEEEAEA